MAQLKYTDIAVNKDGLVTFILPNYNHEIYLDESISGVLNQIKQKNKLIIIDDGSTDKSVKKIQHLIQNNKSVKFIKHKKNVGCIKTLNEGLCHAQTEFVCFPAADDRLESDYLKKCLPLLQAHPKAAFCSGACYVIDSKGDMIGKRPIFFPSFTPSFIAPKKVKNLLKKIDNFFLGPTVLFRRQYLLEMRGFNPELNFLTDGMMARQLALTHGFCFIPSPLASWRFLKNNQSVKNIIDKEYLEALLKNSKNYISQQTNGLFPLNYEKLLERRLRFGSARLKILMASSFQKDQVLPLTQILNLSFVEKKIFFILSNLPLKISKFLLMGLTFIVTRPFSISYFLQTILKRQIRKTLLQIGWRKKY